MRRFWILFLAAALAAAPASAGLPRKQPVVGASDAVTGTANVVASVNVPVMFAGQSGFDTPVCSLYVRTQVNGEELVVPSEGPVLLNVNPALAACSVGFAHYPSPLIHDFAFTVDCPASSPIPYGAILGEMKVSTFGDTDAGEYPVDIIEAHSYKCEDGTQAGGTPNGTRLIDGKITVN